MDIKIFEFPTVNDGIGKIEKKFCEVYRRYRDGKHLEPEEITWMDYANNYLISVETGNNII
jgi:hypothetical protein